MQEQIYLCFILNNPIAGKYLEQQNLQILFLRMILQFKMYAHRVYMEGVGGILLLQSVQ